MELPIAPEWQGPLVAAGIALIYLLGFLVGLHAILYGRTSQGTIAWIMALIAMPLVALPLYGLFGRKKFLGYVSARRQGDRAIHYHGEGLRKDLASFRPDLETGRADYELLESLARLPFTEGNEVELLIDGEDTFAAIFEAIDAARDYILLQFFIVRETGLGDTLKQRLMEKVRAGVRVYFMYDEMGSRKLRKAYWRSLRKAGAEVTAFNTTRGWNAFHLNFRNHRKIVLVDGEVAFFGGHNVGDEYLGLNKAFGPWRDTHVQVRGPAVQCVQLSFMEDWYWATSRLPELNEEPRRATDPGQSVLVLPSGPADRLDTCSLMFAHAISMARERFWLVSPYFVPEREVVSELQLAALRGVDVRILLPDKPDHLLVYLASFSFLDELDLPGITFYRYEPGFLHQKAMVVDEHTAILGTANADNRSFRLNFELSMVNADPAFNHRVADMLEADFANSREVGAEDDRRRGPLFRIGVRLARLLSPIL